MTVPATTQRDRADVPISARPDYNQVKVIHIVDPSCLYVQLVDSEKDLEK